MAVMKGYSFWDVGLSGQTKENWRFGGTPCLHFQGQEMGQAKNWHETGSMQKL
jgi:hypothetical protein